MAHEIITMWLVIGTVAGLLAGIVREGYGFGTAGNVAVGILGAMIAGSLADSSGMLGSANIGSVVMSGTIGAAMALFLLQFIRKR